MQQRHPLGPYVKELIKGIANPIDFAQKIEDTKESSEWFGRTWSPALIELSLKELRR